MPEEQPNERVRLELLGQFRVTVGGREVGEGAWLSALTGVLPSPPRP